MKISQRLSHVCRVEEDVHEEAKGEGKERIPESSQCALGYCGWSKELVEIFLSNFVWIFTGLTKVVDKGCNLI